MNKTLRYLNRGLRLWSANSYSHRFTFFCKESWRSSSDKTRRTTSAKILLMNWIGNQPESSAHWEQVQLILTIRTQNTIPELFQHIHLNETVPQCSYLSQIQPLLLIGRLQLLQLMCSVVDVWFRQVMALHVLSLMTSLDTFHNSNRCSRSM